MTKEDSKLRIGDIVIYLVPKATDPTRWVGVVLDTREVGSKPYSQVKLSLMRAFGESFDVRIRGEWYYSSHYIRVGHLSEALSSTEYLRWLYEKEGIDPHAD